jgi:hypothetical protein
VAVLGKMRPRDEQGWRVPRPNTISASIYALAKEGMGAAKIAHKLGRKVNNVRVHLFKIRHPERANELGNARRTPRKRKITTPEEAHARKVASVLGVSIDQARALAVMCVHSRSPFARAKPTDCTADCVNLIGVR